MNSEAVVHCKDRESVTPNLFSDPNNGAGNTTKLYINDGNLLYVPNRGKTPAKLDRAKLLAASALAANSG
jgi:hypothetical protein